MECVSNIPSFSAFHSPTDGWNITFASPSTVLSTCFFLAILVAGRPGKADAFRAPVNILVDAIPFLTPSAISVLPVTLVALVYGSITSKSDVPVQFSLILVCAEGSKSSEIVYVFRSTFTTSLTS